MSAKVHDAITPTLAERLAAGTDRLVSIREASGMLGLSYQTCRRVLAPYLIRSAPRRPTIRLSDVQSYLERMNRA